MTTVCWQPAIESLFGLESPKWAVSDATDQLAESIDCDECFRLSLQQRQQQQPPASARQRRHPRNYREAALPTPLNSDRTTTSSGLYAVHVARPPNCIGSQIFRIRSHAVSLSGCTAWAIRRQVRTGSVDGAESSKTDAVVGGRAMRGVPD